MNKSLNPYSSPKKELEALASVTPEVFETMKAIAKRCCSSDRKKPDSAD